MGWRGTSRQFWVDPAEQLTVLFFTQLAPPSGTYRSAATSSSRFTSAIVDWG